MDRPAFIAKLCTALERPAGSLTGTTKLGADVWDSVALLNTIALIDEDFGLAISGDDLNGCASVNDLLDMLDGKLAARSKAG